MSFLYRAAITITRNQPYLDWANGLDDGGPDLTPELASDRRSVYLVPEADGEPDLSALLDEFWQHIFEEELGAWIVDDARWPSPLTRELFGAWFAVEVTDTVFDLVPDEPLTQADVDALDLEDAVTHCAWCGVELEEGTGRLVGLPLADREQLAHREGLAISIGIDEEQVAVGILSSRDSAAAGRGDDLIFRACTSRCEKALRRVVPKALRKVFGSGGR
jgi:ribosomal protein L24E